MNPKTTVTLVVLAAGLFTFIFFFERHLGRRTLPPDAFRAMPELNVDAVTSVQVRPAGQLEICVERTNGTWLITKPIVYPAQAELVEALLRALERLDTRHQITLQELKTRDAPEREFGFDPPRSVIIINQHRERIQVHIGRLAPLKDRLFVRVVGKPEVFTAEASMLSLIPQTAADWRDTALIQLGKLSFDRVLVLNNGSRVFELAWNTNTGAWRLVWPIEARADSRKIDDLLAKLGRTRVTQFVTDDPGADLDAFGLLRPGLELVFGRGTNTVAHLQFGSSPGGDAALLYARRAGQPNVLVVPAEPIHPWRTRFEEFRDRSLVRIPAGTVDAVEVIGAENFAVRRLTENQWQVVGTNSFAADTLLLQQMFGALEALEVAEFVKYVVTEHDLPSYGLNPPARQYILRSGKVGATGTSTNGIVAHLMFGNVQGDKVYAKRADEDSVYAVQLSQYVRLPSAGWQLRDRRIWQFTENDVVRLIVREKGKLTELRRTGTNQWTFAPGSQGILNPFAVEETVHRLGMLTAVMWLGYGNEARASYKFTDQSDTITVETRNGTRFTLELGGFSPRALPCGAVLLDGQPWVFELYPHLYDYINSYLKFGHPAQ
ncbi:MAG: DUF4340 domain-containing protein [Verrucomicrobiales bacterium]|nr:DUF4340 domain-containing protein [Verrucomicrobiales bacterium]